ncbi:toll-like receptor 3 [Patella vulgata]|uniref:toll-like receptor 3 n=1 Tax=Patella vulgata TaxID=6465 RepID=UPI00217FD8FB|nr:toll-like receptor 3 [Patella vulgata]
MAELVVFWKYVFLFTLMVFLGSVHDAAVPHGKPCIKHNNRMICWCSLNYSNVNCSSQGLDFIPVLPNNTTVLDMSNNTLTDLNRNTTKNITNKHLSLLNISHNHISFIENGFLAALDNLTTLDVSTNPLSIANLTKSLKNNSRKLKTIFMEGMKWTKFPYDVMKVLENTTLSNVSVNNNSLKTFGNEIFPHMSNLVTLQLSANKIRYFHGNKTFPYLPNLTHLDLSDNFINNVNLSGANSLTYLSLSSNDLTDLPVCCSNNNSLVPKLQELFMDNNCISVLMMDNINCLDELHLLNVSATRIQSIESYTFAKLKSLHTLTIERTESLDKQNSIKAYAFSNPSLHRLFIRYNQINFDPFGVNVAQIFANCTNLTNLDLSGNHLGQLTKTDWSHLLQNVPNLIYLDISDAGVMYLPKPIPNVLTNLRTFHFKKNQATIIPTNYFKNFRHLTMLLLNDNKFTTITSEMLPDDFLSHLLFLDLAFNPFECNCDLLWFLTLARRLSRNDTKTTLLGYPKYYECTGGKTKLKDVTITKRGCLFHHQTNTIIECTCAAVIIILMSISFVYRYRWHFRYFKYILNLHRRKGVTSSNEAFTSDMYVSCSRSDLKIVWDRILGKLEQERLNIFVRHIHIPLGTPELSGILKAMDESKLIMLCISDTFAQDHLCEFETAMAINRSLTVGTWTLIVIVLEELSSENVTKTIHRLIQNDDNYILWDKTEETNNSYNWTRLLRQIHGSDNVNQSPLS